MTIKGILLAGAALCTLGSASALAAHAPSIHVLALHAGAAVKTVMNQHTPGNVTSTIAVTTAVSTASAYKVKTKLAQTYYTYISNSSICGGQPKKEKVMLSVKKTMYAKLGTSTETYSEGCSSGPLKFYGDTYTLKTKKAAGSTDSFVSTLEAKFHNASGKQNGDLNIDVSVAIGS